MTAPTCATSLPPPIRSSRAISDMERHRDIAPSKLAAAAFQQRPGQLLNEQRHAAGTFDHGVNGFTGERIARRHPRYHFAHVSRTQPVEVDLRRMRAPRPLRVKLGPRRI